MRLKPIYIILLCAFMLISLPRPTGAQTTTDSINSGINWLLSVRYGIGLWAFSAPPDPLQTEFTADDFTPTYMRDTLEAVNALQAVNVSITEYESTLNWIEFFNLPSTAHVGQKIQIISKAGKDATKAVSDLAASRNRDGGFGGAAGYPSNILDTASALQGLAAAPNVDTTAINQATSYLISAQNTDGGWGFLKGDPSKIYFTSLTMQALETQPKTTSIANSLSKAATYLISQQQTNGSWGSIFETALSYQALVRSNLNLTSRNAALLYLTSAQLSDGSWNQDPYSTALAIRALSDSGVISAPKIQNITLSKTDGTVATSYSAYDTISISVQTADPNLQLEITVQDNQGTVYSTRTEGGSFFFDTQNLSPGTYTIIVSVIDPVSGIIIDEQTTTFTISATIAIKDASLLVIPSSTHVGALENIALTLFLTNRSNTQATLTIAHEIKSPSGAILNSGVTPFSLSSDTISASIILATFTHSFIESGEYPIQAKVFNGTLLLSTANSSISAAPNVRIDPTKTLTPQTVTPDGDKRIRINIHLEGVEEKP